MRIRRIALGLGCSILGWPAVYAQAGPSERFFLVLAKPGFPNRTALLEALREQVTRRNGSSEPARIAAQLEAEMTKIAAELAPWLQGARAEVRDRHWIVPALEVTMPLSSVAQLAKCPWIADVQRIVPAPAHTIDATSAKNHNMDAVQTTLGWTGRGVALALVDSGIDFLCTGNGNNPHPAFDAAGSSQATRIRKATDLDTTRNRPDDVSGHGTSVASIAVGSKRRWSIAFGGKPDDGFAPDADVLSYRISGVQTGSADPALVVKAWQQVLLDATNPAYPPLVVSVHSFGGSPSPQDSAQMAMDACAVYADVLHVTSAGNAGGYLSPTYASQSNCNGIAVGGVAMVRTVGVDRHRVWSDSSYGPLRQDSLRYFPDLVAACTDVSSAKQDAPAFMTRDSGTSLAAPMVAGSALVLRAADRTLSAIDTKAILLNYTEDVSADNPNRDRNYFGLGMLRSDLAVQGLRAGRILRGKFRRDEVETLKFTLRLGPDQCHAATLAWMRPDPYVEPLAWANLDLRVYDSGGRLLATSESPRNLYEKCVFRLEKGQECTIEVRALALPTEECAFAIAVGPQHGGCKALATYEHFGTSCAGSGIDPGSGVQVPGFASYAWGYDHTTQPFASAPLRMQQAYGGEAFPPHLTVTHLALRRDNEQDFTPPYTVDLEVRMGLTAKPPNGLSATFAQNWIPGSEQVVFADPAFRVSGTRGITYEPDRYDFVIPLQAPYLLKASKDHHVLVEFKVRSSTLTPGSPPHYFDLEATRAGRYGRVVAMGNASASAGTVDPFGLTMSFLGPPYQGRRPNLQAPFAPEVGKAFEVVLRHAPAGAPAAILYAGQAQLVRLDAAGAPGCSLLSDLVLTLPVGVGPAGEGVHGFLVPDESALLGLTVFQQFVIADPGANALGLVVTNAGKAILGG